MADPWHEGWLPAADAGAVAAGFRHELGIYGSDEEFGELICPFAFGGLETGEPVVFAYDPFKTALLQQWLPAAPGITYVTDTGPYATPAKALAAWRRVAQEHLGTGARRVRIAGDVPHPGYGRPYAGWDRYEAALDRALGDLAVWAPCLYDARIAPAAVLETAVRLHRQVLERDGTSHANDSFQARRRLGDFLAPPPDPLERALPVIELLDPTPLVARAAVRQAAAGLSTDEADGVVLATSEAVANAFLHGLPPVTVRVWVAEARIVVTVHDRGNGPTDPLAGLLASDGEAEGGRGLWLAHHLDLEVVLVADDVGFTVRLRTGAPG